MPENTFLVWDLGMIKIRYESWMLYLISVDAECTPYILEGSSSLWKIFFMRSTAATLVIKQMNKGIERMLEIENNVYLEVIVDCCSKWNILRSKKRSYITPRRNNFWRFSKIKKPQKNNLKDATVQGHLQGYIKQGRSTFLGSSHIWPLAGAEPEQMHMT